jgi:omega-6 fatty acid desaturase (delta-12 desaturase)
MQGCIFTGIWIIAHECGHGAFSDYKLLNDTLGWTLHSALLVPFFSWKISHRNHHANTGSSEHDEAFVPFRKSTHSAKEMMEDSPLYSLFLIFSILTLGWLPGYLIKNMGGPPKYW